MSNQQTTPWRWDIIGASIGVINFIILVWKLYA